MAFTLNTRPRDPAWADTIVPTENGSVHCICPVTAGQRDLAFQGFEAARNTLHQHQQCR
jgi:hypothetical protein